MEFIFQILSQLLPSVEEDQKKIQPNANLASENVAEEQELAVADNKEEVVETNLFSMMEFH